MRRLGLAGFTLLVLALPGFRAAGPQKALPPTQEPRYDPATVVDIDGIVGEVHESPASAPLGGLYLILKTETEDFDVYLGPTQFIRSFDITFKRGDRAQAAGSRIKYGGSWIVLAREVRWDDSTLYLRDKQGRPYWPAPTHSGTKKA